MLCRSPHAKPFTTSHIPLSQTNTIYDIVNPVSEFDHEQIFPQSAGQTTKMDEGAAASPASPRGSSSDLQLSNVAALEPQTSLQAGNLSDPADLLREQDLDEPELCVDLRLLDYASEYDQHLACSICRCPYIDPISLPCSHSYCSQCYYNALQAQPSDTKSCPTCRRRIIGEPLDVPRFIKHIIDDLLVRCPNQDCGCCDIVKRGDVQDHVDLHCKWALVSCPDRTCSKRLPRGRITTYCLHGVRQCADCLESVILLDMETHAHWLCEVARFECKQCGSNFPCSQRDKHRRDCPALAVVCSAHDVGCNREGRRDAMKEHEAACSLVKVAPTVRRLSSRTDQQQSEIRSLKMKNDILEVALENVRSHLPRDGLDTSDRVVDGEPGLLAVGGNEDTNGIGSQPQDAPFDSAAHHMLSLHESLREEVDRLSSAISDVDGKSSMTILNETLRIREEMSHQNAVISNLRVQLQWLMSARLQTQVKGPAASSVANVSGSAAASMPSNGLPNQPIRRLSDSSRGEVKL